MPLHVDETEVPLKSIPANIEAERAVLGALLIDPDAFIRLGSILRAEDFYRERHAWLFEALFSLNERREPSDFVTLTDELERRGRLEEIGGPAYVADLINSTPTAIHIEHYANIVAKESARRRVIVTAGRMAEMAYDPLIEIEEIVDSAERQILSLGAVNHKQRTTSEILHQVLADAQDAARNGNKIGIPTGFYLLDKTLGGFRRKQLVVVAGRPGMGKSGFGLSVLNNMTRLFDARCALFTYEMTEDEQATRLLSMETAINSDSISKGLLSEDDWMLVFEASNAIAQRNLIIEMPKDFSISYLRSRCRRLVAEQGLDVVGIDYMQLMMAHGFGSDQRGRQEAVSYIARSLKNLAVELDISIMALAQLNRAVESRADKRPMLSDLADSGEIEKAADKVLFLYRDDYYNEDSDRKNIAEVISAKNRQGGTGTVSLYFRKELTQFRDLTVQRNELNY